MKVTVLGSSHGVPEPGRRCACTMLQLKDRTYFVDMGMPAVNELVTRGIPMESVQGIFFTHMHGDHTDGLIQFVDLATWYFKKADPVICLPKPEAAEVISAWISVIGCEPRPMRYAAVREGVVFDDGYVKVTAIPTKHCDRSFALLVEAEGKSLLFTGDLAGPDKDFPAVDAAPDLLFCEAAHFPATDYIPVLSKLGAGRICVTHYAPWNIPNVQTLAKTLETPVVFANDGMEFEL